MISNFTGTECDTVDFKDDFFKQIYQKIYQTGKGDKFLSMLEKHDTSNDGKINADQLVRVLVEVTSFEEDKIRRFVRQLDKDEYYKISYQKLSENITTLGNKSHNPLKSLV